MHAAEEPLQRLEITLIRSGIDLLTEAPLRLRTSGLLKLLLLVGLLLRLLLTLDTLLLLERLDDRVDELALSRWSDLPVGISSSLDTAIRSLIGAFYKLPIERLLRSAAPADSQSTSRAWINSSAMDSASGINALYFFLQPLSFFTN